MANVEVEFVPDKGQIVLFAEEDDPARWVSVPLTPNQARVLRGKLQTAEDDLARSIGREA
jgi:hypothetical protein